MNLEIAQRLTAYRKQNHLSQEELAEKIGVSRQAVSKWECCEASPDTDNLIALAHIYQVSLDELIYGTQTHSNDDSPCTETSPSIGGKEALDDTDSSRPEANDLPPEDETIAEEEFSSFEEIPPSSSHFSRFYQFPYPILCTILYLCFGFLNICGGWAAGWIIFLTIPLYYTLIEAIKKRKPVILLIRFWLLSFT